MSRVARRSASAFAEEAASEGAALATASRARSRRARASLLLRGASLGQVGQALARHGDFRALLGGDALELVAAHRLGREAGFQVRNADALGVDLGEGLRLLGFEVANARLPDGEGVARGRDLLPRLGEGRLLPFEFASRGAKLVERRPVRSLQRRERVPDGGKVGRRPAKLLLGLGEATLGFGELPFERGDAAVAPRKLVRQGLDAHGAAPELLHVLPLGGERLLRLALDAPLRHRELGAQVILLGGELG